MKLSTKQSRKNNVAPTFEALENRQLMSVSPLVINGTAGNDVITVNYGTALVVSAPLNTAVKAAVAQTAVRSTSVATAATTAATKVTAKALAVVAPTIFNRLTYTVNGVTKSTTLAAGQFVQINGLAGNDAITITGKVNCYVDGGDGNDTIRGGSGNDTLLGSAGNDVIYTGSGTSLAIGGDGNDSLYAGTGESDLYGGNGDDVMVTIGGNAYDSEYGGAGNNSFWLGAATTQRAIDATTAEAKTNVHRVASYDALHVDGVNKGTPSLAEGIGNLPDPDSTYNKVSYGYKNFSNIPLFGANGPSENDIVQGGADDCYFLSVLAATAKNDPNRIRQSVVDLGDGTYAVDFKKGSVDHFVRVDADLPVNSSGNLVFDHFGTQPADLWVPIMEKAWAFFRTGAGTYQSTGWGFPSESFNALGVSNSSYDPNSTGLFGWQTQNATDFSNEICSLLEGGNSVVICTNPSSLYLENSHCYTVDHVNFANGKVASITLRNPWGHDGKGGDSVNDGYLTLTGLDVEKSIDLVTWGKA